jgi:hypothetical protein
MATLSTLKTPAVTKTAPETPKVELTFPYQEESIAVAGSQHDEGSGNKLMFVNQAIRKILSYPIDGRVLVIFKAAYTSDQLSEIGKAASKHNARIVTVNSANELLAYINDNTQPMVCAPDRSIHPIRQLDIFAHGLVGYFAFGYELPEDMQYRFTNAIAATLKPKAFTKEAKITSFACRTGLGNASLNIARLNNEPLMEDKSLAQAIANSTKRTVLAFRSRSDYSATLTTSDDRWFMRKYKAESPFGLTSKADDAKYAELQKKINSEQKIGSPKAVLTPDGAYHDVFGGNTPINVPNNQMSFSPSL